MTIALDRRSTASTSSPRLLFVSFALLLTSALAVVVYVVPLNANDFLQHLLWFEMQSFTDVLAREFVHGRRSSSDWRPLQFPIGYALYYVAKGHEHLAFKGLLAAFLFVNVWLLARVMQVWRWGDAAAASIALLIFFGHHSFAGAVEGVYPYGVEIILLACEIAVLAILLRDRRSVGTEIAAFALSLFAILLNEKGGIVGATYIAGSLLRLPGGSLRCAGAVLAAYVSLIALRLNWFAMAVDQRGLAGSSAQVLFDVAAPALNVLISDPRFGKFRTFHQAFVWGHPWAIVTVATSLTTLALITWWTQRNWRSGATELRVAVLLPVTLACSMIFGAFSNKDYIPIMALPAYALVSFYAMRWLFAQRNISVAVVVGAVLFAGWSIRTAGLFYYMHRTAHDFYNEWAVDAERHARFDVYPRAVGMPILERLRADGTLRRFPYTDDLMPEWLPLWLRGRGCPEFCGNYD